MTMSKHGGRAGWRLFACTSCNRVWWAATRDRFSESSEMCRCIERIVPLDSIPDESLAVDEWNNLVGDPPDRVLREGSGLPDDNDDLMTD